MPIHLTGLTETREVKATLTASYGKVLAWSTDKETGHISLAVPGDRAKLTAKQALALAEWLTKQAQAISPYGVRPEDHYAIRR